MVLGAGSLVSLCEQSHGMGQEEWDADGWVDGRPWGYKEAIRYNGAADACSWHVPPCPLHIWGFDSTHPEEGIGG